MVPFKLTGRGATRVYHHAPFSVQPGRTWNGTRHIRSFVIYEANYPIAGQTTFRDVVSSLREARQWIARTKTMRAEAIAYIKGVRVHG